MKRIVAILVGILILAGIPLTVLLVMRSQELRKKAAPATNLSLSPSSVTKNANDDFTLEARIDTADNNVVATQINLIFDPTKLEATSITNGTLFPNILSSGTIGNGTASVAVGAANTASPVHGTGTAAVIKFKALAATTSPITVRFATDTFVGALGEGSTNVLVGTSPATITITGPLSPTLQPTLIPTPTSTGSGQIATSSAVTIVSPIKNGSVATQEPTIQGKAPPGSTVTIVIHSDEQITTTVVADASGNWTYTVARPISSGPHSIIVSAQNPQTGAVNTATINFVIASGNDNSASNSAMPATGTFETTILFLALGTLFIITGLVLPAWSQTAL